MSSNPGDPGEAELATLVEAARRARANAYAPYSGYRVGAALRATDGRIFAGANVENSAYPSSLCAEHAAVGAAVSAGARRFDAIAVCTEPEPGRAPGSPCGKCRQVLAEFGLELVVLLAAPEGTFERIPLASLLPRAFTGDDL